MRPNPQVLHALPHLRLGPRCHGLPGRQRRADAAEGGGFELPHELADILQLSRARAVCAHPLRRYHGLMQGLRQIEPGQLGGGQGDELDPERLDSVRVPLALAFAWRERGVSRGESRRARAGVRRR